MTEHADSPPSTDAFLAKLCVLVVEDMPDQLRMMAHFLGDAGARVLMAVDGIEALRLARLTRPDVVVLDVNLPALDGFSVCRALQEQEDTAPIPVLFVSGTHDVSTKLLAFAVGGRDFITKPFNDAELIARVALHTNLDRRQRTRLPDVGLPRWLCAALQRLQSSLTEPPELEALALEVGTTAHRLQEAFRHHLHTTPACYVREARLTQAAWQLRESSTPVAEVGLSLGYANPANFSTAFRERFGVSPSKYRQGSGSADEAGGPQA